MYCVINIITITKEISRQFAPKLMRPSRGSSAPIDPLFFLHLNVHRLEEFEPEHIFKRLISGDFKSYLN